MHKAILQFLLLALTGSISSIASSSYGRLGPPQAVDAAFDSHVARPAYVKEHPRVLFDEGHNNYHTSSGRYKPFSDLMTSDGFRIVPTTESITGRSLKGHDILIISGASGPRAQREASPFSEVECDAIRDWVKVGGRLLLIADHSPFGAAAATLGQRFAVDITKGHTIDTSHYDKSSGDQTELLFTGEDGLIGGHPITSGRDGNERIGRVLTYSGTSLKGPAGSVALLKLADTAKDVLPPDQKTGSSGESPADHQTVSADGRAQALALEFGKGRVVVLGSAAMLTAQVTPDGFHFGINVRTIDNRQFALNVMHWLSGLLR